MNLKNSMPAKPVATWQLREKRAGTSIVERPVATWQLRHKTSANRKEPPWHKAIADSAAVSRKVWMTPKISAMRRRPKASWPAAARHLRALLRGRWSRTGPSGWTRSEEHTSELQSLMRISYAVFCLKKKKTKQTKQSTTKSTTKHRHRHHTQT